MSTSSSRMIKLNEVYDAQPVIEVKMKGDKTQIKIVHPNTGRCIKKEVVDLIDYETAFELGKIILSEYTENRKINTQPQ